jgi:hypothetical protein
MTNSEAFQEYYPSSSRAELVLTNKGITPAGTEDNAVSSAWGMIESATSADYSQGRTSEKLSPGARSQLIKNAKQILKDNGIYYNDGSTPTVSSTKW